MRLLRGRDARLRGSRAVHRGEQRTLRRDLSALGARKVQAMGKYDIECPRRGSTVRIATQHTGYEEAKIAAFAFCEECGWEVEEAVCGSAKAQARDSLKATLGVPL